MRFFYTLIFRLAMPVILLRLLWRSRYLPAYRHRWRERFALFPTPEKQGGIWIHAVSFGESVAAIPIIKDFQKKHPTVPIAVTNMTPTGSEKMRATFGDSIFNVYVPYDLPGIMRRFIKKINPKLVVIIETELWPNMLHELKKSNIPVLLANGRLSARSATNYQRIKKLTKSMLNCFTKILVQTEIEAERYAMLGCPADKLLVTGSIKFDITIPDTLNESLKLFQAQLGENREIFIAASTHEGEEEIILEAFRIAKKQIPDLLLVLVPRHPERFEKVAKLCLDYDFKVIRRSSQQACNADTDVFLGDTMGEMLLFYAAADVAFVGGSFVPVGGHNVLEPAALGKAIIVGPHMENFLRITELLKQANAIRQLDDTEKLAKRVIELIQLPSLRRELGLNAEKVVMENRGALLKHLEIIDSFFMA